MPERDASDAPREGAGHVVGANPESLKIASYPAFDWLRFVLASIVVLDHSGFRFAEPLGGSVAVDVFFVLSGWLIGGILLRTKAAELPRFYFNRATRIWIPYGVAIGLLYGIAILRQGGSFFWAKYLFLDATFTHNLWTIFPRALFEMPLKGSGNQFWSISVEEQFYLLAPLLLIFLRIGRSPLLWAAISAVAIYLGIYGAPIALGVTAAIVREQQARELSASLRLLIAVATVAAFALMYAGLGRLPEYGFALGVVLLTSFEGLRNGVAIFFGGLSFPLYLNHWLGVFVVNFFEKIAVGLPRWLTVASAYVVSVGIAAVLYWAIDRQIQLRRGDWYSPAVGRSLAFTAYALVVIGIAGGWAMNRFGPAGVDPATGAVAPAQSAPLWQGRWP